MVWDRFVEGLWPGPGKPPNLQGSSSGPGKLDGSRSRGSCDMALELLSGADFGCNRHCKTNPVDLEGYGAQVLVVLGGVCKVFGSVGGLGSLFGMFLARPQEHSKSAGSGGPGPPSDRRAVLGKSADLEVGGPPRWP